MELNATALYAGVTPSTTLLFLDEDKSGVQRAVVEFKCMSSHSAYYYYYYH